MRGDRRRPTQPDPSAAQALTWRDALGPVSAATDDARACIEALGVPPGERALCAFGFTERAFGIAVAPLLDPRVGVDLMRLHHATDDLLLVDLALVGDAARDVVARIVERSRVGESDLTVVEASLADTQAVRWKAGFLSLGPRRAHRDAASLGVDDPPMSADATHTVRFSSEARPLVVRACGALDPLHSDDRVARNAGLPRALVPPRALALAAWCLLDRASGASATTARFRASYTRTLAWDDSATLRLSADARTCLVVDDAGALLVTARLEDA